MDPLTNSLFWESLMAYLKHETALHTLIHVVKGNSGSLLSYTTATTLNLIKIQLNHVDYGQTAPIFVEDLQALYPNLFNEIH